jgi:mono/diheme cytochrome c family protein
VSKITSVASLQLTILLLVVGCKGREQATGQTTPAPVASAPAATGATAAPAGAGLAMFEAQRVFKNKCTVCHGQTGDGDGPGAAALNPKPRAFKDPSWQASVTDEHLKKIIVGGGPAVGKSPIMPPNPDLRDKDEVVAELVKLVRGFKQSL